MKNFGNCVDMPSGKNAWNLCLPSNSRYHLKKGGGDKMCFAGGTKKWKVAGKMFDFYYNLLKENNILKY